MSRGEFQLRMGLTRILMRNGLNRLPASQKHRAHKKRWKRYEKRQPGHRLQVDVKFLERVPGTRKRLYQFTAVDDCTKDTGLEDIRCLQSKDGHSVH